MEAQFKYGFLSGALPCPAALDAGQFSGCLHMLALLPQNSHPPVLRGVSAVRLTSCISVVSGPPTHSAQDEAPFHL